MIPKEEIAAGRVRIVFEFITSGTFLAITVITTGGSLRGGPHVFMEPCIGYRRQSNLYVDTVQ